MNMCEKGRTTMLRYIIVFGCIITLSTCSIMGDECDWTGSGLSTAETNRGVTPVYLRCSAGRISWMYPRGALRVLLRLPAQDRDFRACIKVRHTDKRLPVRLFLEGPRSLLPLYSQDDGGSKLIRCFTSKQGQSAIYIEATEYDPVKKQIVEIEYDLQHLPRGKHGYDPSEECRPCTAEELANAFCTSDLVTRGTIHTIDNRDDLELSEMSVKITKLIRHTTDDAHEEETNLIGNAIFDNEIENLNKITVYVAQHCGISHGMGEFVFMARKKLGDLRLQCAPRVEDWAVLVNQLSEEGKSHCMLKS